MNTGKSEVNNLANPDFTILYSDTQTLLDNITQHLTFLAASAKGSFDYVREQCLQVARSTLVSLPLLLEGIYTHYAPLLSEPSGDVPAGLRAALLSDFRSPVMTMISACALLLDEDLGTLNDNQKRHLTAATNGLYQMLDNIENFAAALG